ncbi:MAG: dipeptide ABC transporter ATP-binding protein [Alphaproteobacteria bacterium]
MTATAPVLRVENLSVAYGTPSGPIAALSGVSFDIARGEALALVGESGSGKSTAALAILDLLGNEGRVESGRIAFMGEEIGGWDRRRRAALRGSRIGTVFQDPFTSLNPSLTIGIQVAEPLMMHRRLSRRAALAEARSLLHEVGIPNPAEVARSYPHQLSGGMQQRALIAGALSCEPTLLILDEPTTALDVTIEAQLLDLLKDLQERHHLSILFITHNLAIVSSFCRKVCVLYAGRVLEYGSARETLLRPGHPYTKGLAASSPRFVAGDGPRQLPSIPGRFPSLAEPAAGCIFHPRCPFVESRCIEAEPATIRLASGNLARCWKAEALDGVPWRQAVPPAAPPREHRKGGELIRLEALQKHFSLSRPLAKLRIAWQGGWRFRLTGARSVVRAVDGVSLAIASGEVLGLVGESGCGKSTLGRCVVRLLTPTGGRILLAGADVTRAPEAALKPLRKRVQIVFQNPDSSLNPRKRVAAILGRPLEMFGAADPARRQERIAKLLDDVGLSAGYAQRYPHQLSGGEKQRVGIARALASAPDFIVCDEAVSALDVSVQATILNLLAELKDRLGLGYLFISHDLAVVAHISDRIAVMYAGALVEIGRTAQVLHPPYHPYTETLLSSIPASDPALERKNILRPRSAQGSAEDAVRAPAAGCRFQDRCARKLGAICEREEPPLVEVEPGHSLACHIPLASLRQVAPVIVLQNA